MLKYYGKKPKLEQIRAWNEKRKDTPQDLADSTHWVEYEIPFGGRSESPMKVTKGFFWYWSLKTKFPFILNIIGLILIIIQIVLQ